MASSTNKKGSKKKGRAARKPSHNRYNAERRWEVNKARRAEKLRKEAERKARRKAKRG